MLLLLLCCFSYVWPYGSSHIRSIALGISQSPWGDRGVACWCPCLRSQAWRNEGQARAPGLYPMCMYVHTYTTYIYIYIYIYMYIYIYNIYIYISDVDLFHHRSYQWDPWNTILDAIRGRMKSHHPALRGSCWDHGMPGSSLLFIFLGEQNCQDFDFWRQVNVSNNCFFIFSMRTRLLLKHTYRLFEHGLILHDIASLHITMLRPTLPPCRFSDSFGVDWNLLINLSSNSMFLYTWMPI